MQYDFQSISPSPTAQIMKHWRTTIGLQQDYTIYIVFISNVKVSGCRSRPIQAINLEWWADILTGYDMIGVLYQELMVTLQPIRYEHSPWPWYNTDLLFSMCQWWCCTLWQIAFKKLMYATILQQPEMTQAACRQSNCNLQF